MSIADAKVVIKNGEIQKEFPHYYKKLPEGVTHIDVYAVASLFGVTDPALQHALKKMLCAGGRGAKDREKDLREVVASVNRAIDMQDQGYTLIVDLT